MAKKGPSPAGHIWTIFSPASLVIGHDVANPIEDCGTELIGRVNASAGKQKLVANLPGNRWRGSHSSPRTRRYIAISHTKRGDLRIYPFLPISTKVRTLRRPSVLFPGEPEQSSHGLHDIAKEQVSRTP
jgi:hypothetical protein